MHYFLTKLAPSVLLTLLVAATTLAGGARAEDADMPKLGIAPVDAKDSFFAISMKPGDRKQLTVELSNGGTAAISATTYAADVYTLINGGFGVETDDQPPSGTTNWLDYPTETVTLKKEQTVRRTFTLEVPKQTESGAYIAALVIQNAEPVKGSGGVALNQTLRQAIAVSISVPGASRPELTVEEASYNLKPGYVSARVALKNTGNVLLKPTGELVLNDEAGTEIQRAAITMDSFYAGTETFVDVGLVQPLESGRYVVSLVLKDKQTKLSIEENALPFTVANVDAAGTPAAAAGIEIQSVVINELRDPSTQALQAIESVVTIDNQSTPVTNGRLTLHVTRDGEPVEDIVLGSSLSFPGGSAEFRQRYLPLSGWTPGTYAFSVTLDMTDPATSEVTELATADSTTSVVVK